VPAVRNLAKKYLRPYVERGDSPEQICKGHPGAGDSQNCLQIGGQAHVKGKLRQIGPGQLAITRFEGEEYFTTFSVAELCREIRQELEDRDRPKQPKLW
jgi:hypothetical protein